MADRAEQAGPPHTITFFKAMRDPYIANISLGQGGIQTDWTFNAPFSLIDQGQSHWGNGVFTIVGNSISVGEACGVIQFKGNFTSLLRFSVRCRCATLSRLAGDEASWLF